MALQKIKKYSKLEILSQKLAQTLASFRELEEELEVWNTKILVLLSSPL